MEKGVGEEEVEGRKRKEKKSVGKEGKETMVRDECERRVE